MLLLIACSSAVTCEEPGWGDVADADLALTLTPEGDAAGGGTGAALLRDGELAWDVPPAGIVGVTEGDDGFSGDGRQDADGVGVDGCGWSSLETWSVVATWTDDGGFVGTLTWSLSSGCADGDRCDLDGDYTMVGIPR